MTLPLSPRAVITGAGGGLGRALALCLARRKGRLLLSDCDLARASETAALARRAGASAASAVACDVAQIKEVEALGDAADEELGGVDLVVNNAGVSASGLIGEVSLEDWRWTLDVDLWGVIHGCHVFAPRLRRQRGGHVLNVASAAGLVSAPYMAPYNVAKAGVVALSETLSAEVAHDGVGVTVLCPSFFQTRIVSEGRFTAPHVRKAAEALMGRSRRTADEVATSALAAVDRGALYAVPMADARWMWRAKRVWPGAFLAVARKIEERIRASR